MLTSAWSKGLSLNGSTHDASAWSRHQGLDVFVCRRSRVGYILLMPRAATEGLYTQDGEREPTADPAALRAVARHRPRQLLLLGAMVSRGADSASPLVGAPIVLSADLASKIREALHQMPGLCPRAGPSGTGAPVAGEEFAWHDDTATAGGGAAATGAQGSGKRKREDE